MNELKKVNKKECETERHKEKAGKGNVQACVHMYIHKFPVCTVIPYECFFLLHYWFLELVFFLLYWPLKKRFICRNTTGRKRSLCTRNKIVHSSVKGPTHLPLHLGTLNVRNMVKCGDTLHFTYRCLNLDILFPSFLVMQF